MESRAAAALLDQLGQAITLEQAQRFGCDQHSLELSSGVGRRELDQDEVDGDAGDAILLADIPWIDRASAMDLDARARSASPARNGDLGREGWGGVAQGPVKGAGAVAEQSAWAAGERCRKPALLPGVGRGMGGIDASVEAVQAPAGESAPRGARS